jgi:hypothetical protein
MLYRKYQKHLYLLLIISLLFNQLNTKSLGKYQTKEATHKRYKSKSIKLIY